MCQHVRSRGAGSSERGDGPAGVGLRVPGTGSSTICQQLAGREHWARLRRLGGPRNRRNNHRCVRERRRGGRGLQDQETTASDDPRKVCQPWRNACGEPDRLRAPGERGILSRTSVRCRCHETLGPQEARTPKGLQSGSGGRRSRTRGHRPQQSRLQDGFYPPAWPQGGAKATYGWKDTLFSRSLATGVQIGVDIHDKT